MTLELFETASGRYLSYETRHRSSQRSRLDRPDLRPGNLVWWRAGLYAVECVEQHGERWMTVLVKPGQVGQPEVRCWFAPASELQHEPG